MKTKAVQIDISHAMGICIKNGIKVYPVPSGRNFKVEVDNNGVPTRYAKEVRQSEINKAVSDTYKYFAIKLINDRNNASKSTKKEQTLGSES